LEPDNLLITSALAAPVDGMQLRIEENEAERVGTTEAPAESKDQEKP
jgi:hypothetical protein